MRLFASVASLVVVSFLAVSCGPPDVKKFLESNPTELRADGHSFEVQLRMGKEERTGSMDKQWSNAMDAQYRNVQVAASTYAEWKPGQHLSEKEDQIGSALNVAKSLTQAAKGRQPTGGTFYYVVEVGSKSEPCSGRHWYTSSSGVTAELSSNELKETLAQLRAQPGKIVIEAIEPTQNGAENLIYLIRSEPITAGEIDTITGVKKFTVTVEIKNEGVNINSGTSATDVLLKQVRNDQTAHLITLDVPEAIAKQNELWDAQMNSTAFTKGSNTSLRAKIVARESSLDDSRVLVKFKNGRQLILPKSVLP